LRNVARLKVIIKDLELDRYYIFVPLGAKNVCIDLDVQREVI